jgi:uncharacterized membrane protein YhfC
MRDLVGNVENILMVSAAVLSGLLACAVLSVVWPVAIYVICRRRMTLSARNIAVGAGVFFLFSQVLEKALHLYLLKANPATAAWFQAHSMAFALYGSAAAGLFEEVGRYLGMRFLVRASGDPGPAVAYGIGHGGLEAILVGTLAMAQAFVFATMLNAGRLDAVLGPALSPAALAQLRANLEHISVAALAMGTLERLIALLIQIGLSLLVWRAVEKRHFGLWGAAVLIHAAVDFPAALSQAGQLSAEVVEGFLVVVGVALVALFLRRLPRKLATTAALPT